MAENVIVFAANLDVYGNPVSFEMAHSHCNEKKPPGYSEQRLEREYRGKPPGFFFLGLLKDLLQQSNWVTFENRCS